MPQKFQNLKKGKRLKKSSQKWLLRQINDPFVEKAKLEGWRSRAAFKIIEIDEKFKLFKKVKLLSILAPHPAVGVNTQSKKLAKAMLWRSICSPSIPFPA